MNNNKKKTTIIEIMISFLITQIKHCQLIIIFHLISFLLILITFHPNSQMYILWLFAIQIEIKNNPQTFILFPVLTQQLSYQFSHKAFQLQSFKSKHITIIIFLLDTLSSFITLSINFLEVFLIINFFISISIILISVAF